VKGETTSPTWPRGERSGSPVAALVRRHDRDRYQTALFAPAARREALFALYAFNYEIARVRETITQPLLGQIRLQWWREVIDAAYGDRPPRAHVVAQPLTAAIRNLAPSREWFDRMIDARERDLGEETPPTLAALEQYAEATSAALIYLALEVLGTRDAAATGKAREVGIAYALAGLLRTMPFHARAGRCYIPDDIAARVGLDPAEYQALRTTPALRAAVAEIAEAARRRLQAAGRRRVPRPDRAGLLPAVIAERFLWRLRRADHDPFDPALVQPDPLQPWRLLIAWLRGGF
jgi:NADH dehydrogenase [ubiquinone] 1 alpha subcomplex assembly factor 6